MAEVKRNKARYDSKQLDEKYQTIKAEFGKYKEVRLIGLSMEDM